MDYQKEIDEIHLAEIEEYKSNEERLELDSVDILEIVVGIKQLFGLQIKQEGNGAIFYSVNSITDYVYDSIQNSSEEKSENIE